MTTLKKNIKKPSFLGNCRGEKSSILASNRMLEIWKIEERCEVCLNVTIRTPERPHWGRPVVFAVYFGHGRLWTINCRLGSDQIKVLTQLTFACSKSTTEPLEKVVKYVEINNENFKRTLYPRQQQKPLVFWCFQGNGRRSGVFIINFEHVSHLFLVFLLLTLNKYK